MIILRMAGKILLLPVWLLLATAHLLVKIAVEIYCIGKGLINLILGFMLIGTLLWYRQWERFALLAVAGGILLFFLWLGVFMEVILESDNTKLENGLYRYKESICQNINGNPDHSGNTLGYIFSESFQHNSCLLP